MTSALIGTSTEPVIRNSSDERGQRDEAERVRQPARDLVLEVDQERGLAGDVVSGTPGGRLAASVDEPLRVVALRCAGGDDVDRGDVAGAGRLEADVGDAGQRLELGRRRP